MYVCILKSKKAEWEALKELKDEHRAEVQVILELIPTKPVDGVSTSDSAFKVLTTTGAWKAGAFLTKDMDLAIDARLLPKAKQILVAARVASKLRKAGYKASPSVSVPAILKEAGSLSRLAGAKVVTVRVPMLSSVSTAQATIAINAVRKTVGGKAKLRVVLDAEDFPGDIDDNGVVNAAASLAVAIQGSCQVNQIAFAGGSFPQNLVEFKQGIHSIPRREWDIWSELCDQPDCSDVIYGDYTVTHPKLAKMPPNMKIPPKPSPAIRYAVEGEWALYKGVRPKGDKSNKQYKALCQLLIQGTDYRGVGFSYGDKMYTHYASPTTKTGNSTIWRRDATNHHIVQTLDDL